MARLTLRLPDSLRDQLAERADAEGVSLNHYLVFTLAQATAMQSAAEQRKRFDELRERVGREQAESDLKSLLGARTA